MQSLARKDGITYTKPRYFNDWVPGNNVADYYTMKPYKLSGSLIDPGRQWDKVVGAGTIHGHAFFVVKDNSDGKGLVPAEFYHVPYGFKFKKNHKVVHDYVGSLANAWNGMTRYTDDYGSGISDGILTKENTIYSNHDYGTFTVTLDKDGQNTGKNQGFWIGKTPITFRVDGTDTYEDYYPLYNYDPSGELVVSYIKTEDLDQFEPATVTYNWLGTITKDHKFKPEDKKLDL